jgi:hypothetical protein
MMPNNYKGLNISGLKSTTKLSRVQVEPTIDFVEITDRGLLDEPIAKLRTAGAGHQKRSNASPKSAIGTSIDMGELFDVASIYDYGEVEEGAFAVTEDAVWSSRRKLMNPPPPPTTPWVNRDNWNGGTTSNYSVPTGAGYGSHASIPKTNQRSVTFNSDGSIGYIIGQSQTNAFNLSVPYDLDAATRTNSFSSFTIANGSGNVAAIEAVNDGNRVLRGWLDSVALFNLHEKDVFTAPSASSTGFHMGTLTTNSTYSNQRDFSDSVMSWNISGDGTKLTAFILCSHLSYDSGTDTWTRTLSGSTYKTGVIVFNLTSAWDLSTATYFSHGTVSNNWNQTRPKGFMAPDGLTLWLQGQGQINIYSLETAFDISSTKTLLSQANHSKQFSDSTLTVSANGRYVYSTPDQPSNGDKLDKTDFGAP